MVYQNAKRRRIGDCSGPQNRGGSLTYIEPGISQVCFRGKPLAAAPCMETGHRRQLARRPPNSCMNFVLTYAMIAMHSASCGQHLLSPIRSRNIVPLVRREERINLLLNRWEESMMGTRIPGLRRVAVGTALIVVCLAEFARADVAGYDLTEAMVPMRDGVKLHTMIYGPRSTTDRCRSCSCARPTASTSGRLALRRVPEGPGRRRLHLRLPGHPRPVQVGRARS